MPSRLSVEMDPARMLRSRVRELGRGVRVGVTGFGPYEVTMGMGCDLSRAAESSSRSVQYVVACGRCGECPPAGDTGSMECRDRMSSYPVEPGKPS